MSDRSKPLPPEILAGALQDRVHPASGRLLKAEPVGIPPKRPSWWGPEDETALDDAASNWDGGHLPVFRAGAEWALERAAEREMGAMVTETTHLIKALDEARNARARIAELEAERDRLFTVLEALVTEERDYGRFGSPTWKMAHDLVQEIEATK